MPEIVTEDFRKSLIASPTGHRKKGTMFDEIRGALETSENPLDRVIQMISEFHGPWSGSSRQLTDFTTFLASLMNSTNLRNLSKSAEQGACLVEQAINGMPVSSVGRLNNQTAAIMPTPLLREFVKFVQKIHPAINMYIQMHSETFPYFQQISEDVGSFASIVLTEAEVDPKKWPKRNGVNCLDTNSRMNKNTLLKMFETIFFLMDDANNLLNSMFVRAMPPDSMGVIHQSYSQESAIAHGYNLTMDGFNAQRSIAAMANCSAVVINLAQDLLRLINKFFCIKELSRYEVEGFLITMYEGPNGEPISYIVDSTSRPLVYGETSNERTDPTNDNTIKAKIEYKEEKK